MWKIAIMACFGASLYFSGSVMAAKPAMQAAPVCEHSEKDFLDIAATLMTKDDEVSLRKVTDPTLLKKAIEIINSSEPPTNWKADTLYVLSKPAKDYILVPVYHHCVTGTAQGEPAKWKELLGENV